MAPEEFTALDAQIEALDKQSACRVARLVVECGASIPLAMLAVADADARRADVAAKQRRPALRRGFAQICAWAGVLH